MENFSLFLQLLNLNEENKNICEILGKLINQNIEYRNEPLHLDEVIRITNDNNFGFFIGEMEDNDINYLSKTAEKYINEHNIDRRIMLQDFIHQTTSNGFSVSFTDNLQNETKQFIYSPINN